MENVATRRPPLIPPRQTDLICSDKKRPSDSTSSTPTKLLHGERSTTPSRPVTAGTPVSALKDDMSELSRDDRKILQYEQMFQRMEDRRNKKGRRSSKRNPEGSSTNGSPSRDASVARDREDESHEDSTNPPPSPLVMPMDLGTEQPLAPPVTTTIAVASPATISSPMVLPATIFVPPKAPPFAVPGKETISARMRKVRRGKNEKAIARKDSSASESDAATEKADKVAWWKS